MKPDTLTDGIYRVAAKIGNRDLLKASGQYPMGSCRLCGKAVRKTS